MVSMYAEQSDKNGFKVTSYPAVTIAQAREDLDSDFIPDRKSDTLTLGGVVFTPNFQTSNRSYYILGRYSRNCNI